MTTILTNWTISRKYLFAAAHRLEGHPKCGRMHGHNYEVEVFVSDNVLGDEGWIMDYSQLDAVVKPILDELDHRYIVSTENQLADCPYAVVAVLRDDAAILAIMRSTAELIAQWIQVQVYEAFHLLGLDSLRVQIAVGESPKSSARYYY